MKDRPLERTERSSLVRGKSAGMQQTKLPLLGVRPKGGSGPVGVGARDGGRCGTGVETGEGRGGGGGETGWMIGGESAG